MIDKWLSYRVQPLELSVSCVDAVWPRQPIPCTQSITDHHRLAYHRLSHFVSIRPVCVTNNLCLSYCASPITVISLPSICLDSVRAKGLNFRLKLIGHCGHYLSSWIEHLFVHHNCPFGPVVGKKVSFFKRLATQLAHFLILILAPCTLLNASLWNLAVCAVVPLFASVYLQTACSVCVFAFGATIALDQCRKKKVDQYFIIGRLSWGVIDMWHIDYKWAPVESIVSTALTVKCFITFAFWLALCHQYWSWFLN